MGRYRLTPKRRASIRKAQRVSARRRKKSGFLMRFALNKSADLLTKGASSKVQDYYSRQNKKERKMRRAARAARKKARKF